MLVDSHCHLDATEFSDTASQLAHQAAENDVRWIVVPAVEVANFGSVAKLAAHLPNCVYALGIHPLYVPHAKSDDLNRLREAVQLAMADERFVGIGEIGLDFFVPELTTDAMREKQTHFYVEQLKIAREFDLPVILHVRRSQDKLLKHLRRISVVGGIEACDEVHTMTSLSGFDALLRGKKVVTYGQPFYAGWGLTEDRAEQATAFARRTRRLSLDELVAGTLLHYPIYWDWDLKGYTTCEAVLNRIVETRDTLEASGGLARLRTGFFRRQGRKLAILMRAMVADLFGGR